MADDNTGCFLVVVIPVIVMAVVVVVLFVLVLCTGGALIGSAMGVYNYVCAFRRNVRPEGFGV